MGNKRRVLIVSTGRDRGALTGARALGRAGWHVGIGTPIGGGMPGASRESSVHHFVPKPRGDDSAFLHGVQAAIEEGSYDIVFGGGDDWMAALSAYKDQIPAVVAHPDKNAVDAGLDKVVLAEASAAVGLAAPYTVTATPEELTDWQGPVVVKCRAHWSQGQTRPHRIDARLFPDTASAQNQVNRILVAGAEPILQRPVNGGLSALIGIFHEGRLRARVQQVSPRLFPTPYGASSRAVTVPVDEDLVARSEDLLRNLGWSGLVELQFLTGEDGAPHLTDLNGRFYGSMSLAEKARPGLVDAWARTELGEPFPDLSDGRAGVRYSWFAGDLRRAVRERRGGLASDVVDSLRWGLRARHSVWDPKDPAPAGYLVSQRLQSLVPGKV